MIYEAIDIWSSSSLEHYGVPGMKWGVRHDIRAANKLVRYSKKMEKLKSKYDIANERRLKYASRSNKAERGIIKANKRADRIASGKSNFGIWTDRAKKVDSLNTKSSRLAERKAASDKKLFKYESKVNKYAKKIHRYDRKISKLEKRLSKVDISTLDISDQNRMYIDELLRRR